LDVGAGEGSHWVSGSNSHHDEAAVCLLQPLPLFLLTIRFYFATKMKANARVIFRAKAFPMIEVGKSLFWQTSAILLSMSSFVCIQHGGVVSLAVGVEQHKAASKRRSNRDDNKSR
jgi:hypothetical protein